MKLRAKEDISCRYGEENGFGTKLQGEIFEVSDQRAAEIIALGGAEEVKEVATEDLKAKKANS